jgi:hypothetical protein
MSYLSFFAEIFKTITWPGTILTIIILLRKEFGELMTELRHLKYKDFEVDFDRHIERIKHDAHAAGLSSFGELNKEQYDQTKILPNERFLRLAELSPSAAVTEVWIDIELAINELGCRHKINKIYGYHIMEELLHRGILSDKEIKLCDELKKLSNKIIHGGILDLSKGQAQEYRQIALSFIERLNAK